MNETKPKTALVHEFITQLGGAERVLENLLTIYPDAPIFTLINNDESTNYKFASFKKITSFLQYIPGAKNHHRPLLPLMPWATEALNFKGYDIVLADASAFAKGVKVPDSTMLVCYCHTPTRYLWMVDTKEFMKGKNYPAFLHWPLPPLLKLLRRWDYKAAQRPHHYIANSTEVQRRIKKYYNRDSVVVFPPVDTELFHPVDGKENYFFAASRLESYKKIELVIQAFNELGLPLKIAGSGTASRKLQEIAKPNIEFLGRVSDEELRRRYSESLAYIFPADEDAGIMPVEAMACGTPVIAYGAGGILDVMVEGKTGMLFKDQTSDSIKESILKFKPEDYNRDEIRHHAQQFDKKIFRQKIQDLISTWHHEFKNRS